MAKKVVHRQYCMAGISDRGGAPGTVASVDTSVVLLIASRSLVVGTDAVPADRIAQRKWR